jgi:hypothetical protein
MGLKHELTKLRMMCMISPYSIFEVNKLVHDEIFKILNINHIFNIIYRSTAKMHVM